MSQLQDLRDQKASLERQIDAMQKAEQDWKLSLSCPVFMPVSAGRYEDNVHLTVEAINTKHLRLKELIIRGGQNIAPSEIEEAANLHDSVLDCAVAGASHDHLGEVPMIYVVPRPGAGISPDALLSCCRESLSSYKVLTAVHVVDAIPRTGSGKIMRFKLLEMAE